MDSLNIDKFNYKIKANILFDDESLKLSDIGLSWLHCKEKKLIVKTVNKYNDKYTISFKNRTKDIFDFFIKSRLKCPKNFV